MPWSENASSYDWETVKTEYITTNTSYRKLCGKYNIPITTLAERGKREGWTKDRQRHRDRVVAKSVKSAEKVGVNYRDLLYELAYKVAGQLNEMTNNHSIEELALSGIKPKDITGAIKDLEDALHIKSDKDLREQEARIAKMQKEIDADSVDRTITVKLTGETDDWGG